MTSTVRDTGLKCRSLLRCAGKIEPSAVARGFLSKVYFCSLVCLFNPTPTRRPPHSRLLFSRKYLSCRSQQPWKPFWVELGMMSPSKDRHVVKVLKNLQCCEGRPSDGLAEVMDGWSGQHRCEEDGLAMGVASPSSIHFHAKQTQIDSSCPESRA